MQAVVCPITRDVDVHVAKSRGNQLALALGFDERDRTRIQIAISELAHNILAYAGIGELRIEVVEADGRRGVAVEATDRGPGIPDVALAMRDGYSTGRTMGSGLPGVQRLMDAFEIESSVGVGTRVRAVKWPGGAKAGRQGGRP
jgi:anti-sigma regulatory factor (Ser/Thr protein kinase)